MRPVDHVSDKVDRVIGFFSSSPNWDPPPPHPQASVFPPFWFRGGGGGGTVTSGRGGAQWGRGDRHCGTLGKYVFCDDVNLNKRLSSGETTEPYDYAAGQVVIVNEQSRGVHYAALLRLAPLFPQRL